MRNNQLVLFILCYFLVFAKAFNPSRIFRPSSSICRLQDARGGGERGGTLSLATSTLVRDMLWQMTSYFSYMVDPSEHRFYYIFRPPSGDRVHQHFPIRDLAAAWDATKVMLFWNHQQEHPAAEPTSSMKLWKEQLGNAVYTTIQVYNAAYISVANLQEDPLTTDGVCLDSNILREAPTIAHSALMILATTGALRLSLFQDGGGNTTMLPPLNNLTRGILSRQRNDGAFCIHYSPQEGDDVYRGIEFYPGEAMVALMDVYDLSVSMQGILEASTRDAILPAMGRSFDFYADYYHQGNVDTNFNIWQIQAFARFFDALHADKSEEEHGEKQQTLVAAYVLELCRDVVSSRSWKELARGKSFYPNLETVEIACGLDALVDGIRVAKLSGASEDAMLYGRHAENAVHFLSAIQDQVPPEVDGSGGLGFGGIQVLEQRLDVTGHAISALTKLHQLHDECT